MKKLVLGIIIGGIIGAVLILLVMVIFEKNRRHEQNGLRLITIKDSAKIKEPKKLQALVYGNFMDVDSTDYLLIPIGTKTVEDHEGSLIKIKSSDDYSSGSINGNYRNYKYNFYSLDFGNCNNIIFYNKKTDETHLLLKTPAIISQFYFPHYNKEYDGKKYWFLLIAIGESDTNSDGYINNEDAEKVYITDLSGNNMTPITPDNSQLIDWYIDMPTNNILMKVRIDSNNDKKFNDNDEIKILKTSIRSPSLGEQIISDEIQDSIKKILGEIK